MCVYIDRSYAHILSMCICMYFGLDVCNYLYVHICIFVCYIYELVSKLLVYPLIIPIVVPYIIFYIPPLRSLDYSSYLVAEALNGQAQESVLQFQTLNPNLARSVHKAQAV